MTTRDDVREDGVQEATGCCQVHPHKQAGNLLSALADPSVTIRDDLPEEVALPLSSTPGERRGEWRCRVCLSCQGGVENRWRTQRLTSLSRPSGSPELGYWLSVNSCIHSGNKIITSPVLGLARHTQFMLSGSLLLRARKTNKAMTKT